MNSVHGNVEVVRPLPMFQTGIRRPNASALYTPNSWKKWVMPFEELKLTDAPSFLKTSMHMLEMMAKYGGVVRLADTVMLM